MKKMKNNTSDIIQTINKAGEEKAAFDILTLCVKEISDITDYFILMSCKNERHIKAVANEIDAQLKKKYSLDPYHKAGKSESMWIVLDYGDIIIHVFNQDIRGTYALEELWGKREKETSNLSI